MDTEQEKENSEFIVLLFLGNATTHTPNRDNQVRIVSFKMEVKTKIKAKTRQMLRNQLKERERMMLW